MPNPKVGFLCVLCMFGSASAYYDMPNYSTDSVGDALEYVIESQGYHYSIGSIYANNGCVTVYDEWAGHVVGCFQCSGARNSCANAGSTCSGVDIITLNTNERVRTSEDTDTSDIDFCAAPYSVNDSNGFCLSSSYPQTGMYRYNSNTGSHERGNVKFYYSSDSGGACMESFTKTSGPYCGRGYYMADNKCVSCPDGAAAGVAQYHTLGQGAACKSVAPIVSETCTNNQYDLTMYWGTLDDRTCIACPAGAKCDGEYIYCPAGSFVYYPYDDETYPSCFKCPGMGMVANTFFSDTLDSCTGHPDDWGKGISSNCKWTNDIWEDLSECYAYRGTDDSGSFEFRKTNGEWEACPYQY